ncbi:MAG: AI-2E family transporter, partial [Parafilimonas terrae]|nr:AI-2E family transporter [Parafilimonas terrae]
MTDPTVSKIPEPSSASRSVLTTLYAGAVVVAGLYFGHELIVPLVLATLLAFVLAPACVLLQRVRLPRVAAVIVAVLLAFAVIGSLGIVVGRQAANLAEGLPNYRSTVLDKWHALESGDGILARLARGASVDGSHPAGSPHASDDGAAAMFDLGRSSNLALARAFAQPLLGPAGTLGIVLVFTIFILMARDDLRERLIRLVGRQDLHRTILAMNDAGRRLSRYFLFQLGLNAGFGVVVGTCLWAVGLPNPLLWGILSALMRFVPYVGVVIAVAPPLLLAVAVVPGWSLAILVLALFVAAEILMGQVVEPLIYGHSTGLSPLAVIVATAFWALLWGPIGLLIATPLTLCLVVIGRHVEALAFLDVILGDAPPLDPYETFYQRALEGQAGDLLPIARRRIASSSLSDYYDAVALPGLALAQRDLSRDLLAFERLESIHVGVEALLGRLDSEEGARRASTAPDGAGPSAWH